MRNNIGSMLIFMLCTTVIVSLTTSKKDTKKKNTSQKWQQFYLIYLKMSCLNLQTTTKQSTGN